MPTLPQEVWNHVFSFVSAIYKAASSSSDVWAKIVTGNGIHSDMTEFNETKNAISLVCRTFYDASRDFALESVHLRTIGSLRYFVTQSKDNADLANTIARCTRRIDVHIEMRNGRNLAFLRDHNISSERGIQQICDDLEVVVRLCRNLTYFSCRVDGEGIAKFINVLHDVRPFLEVLRWNFTPSMKSECPSFSRLCVLDLSTSILMPGQLQTRKPTDFPHLHTLIGPLNVISPHLHNVELPSLRTLICKRSSNLYPTDPTNFFQRHGEKIKSLDIGQFPFSRHLNLYQHLPHVTELIINSEDERSTEESWPNVRSLGFVDDTYDGDVGSQRILCALNLLDAARDTGDWASLRTVRVFNERTVRYLRGQKKATTRFYERRLKSWSIVLEDGRGDLLMNPCNCFGKAGAFYCFHA